MSEPVARLQVDNSPTAFSDYARQRKGGDPPGGDELQARVQRLEDTFVRIDATLERMSGDMGDVKVSQARIQERMERIMDRTRDMPTEVSVGKALDEKLTILGVVIAIVIGIATLILQN